MMVSSIYLPEPARILDVQQMTALEKLFTLEFFGGRSLGHQSGQFVTVSALGIGEAPISISSSPSRSNGTFELCIRKAGDLTGVLHQKKAGDTLGIRGPFGQGFPLKKFQGKDILFAPGGLGLAPARSVINQVLDERGKYGRVTILYGARTPAELLFKGELEEWDKRDDVDLHVTVDQPDDDWTGNAGVITTLFSKVSVYPRNTVAITIGPPVMYRFVLMELLGKGIPETNIWLSLERRMKCGVGKCGHCQINDLYACQSGPSFSYAEIKAVEGAI
ncbi:MAG: FAD/NAD(P)-binding protein [Anaerolineales bacterium]|jgi:NAD(P)H-flavin reductase|nr:FAD/NAD(P)-binding protein [Anaerolineales bacterium]